MQGPGLPELRTRAWRSTRDTLHAYAQVAGTIRAALTPPEKHWYHVSLRVAASGLTTTPVPAPFGTFEITLECATGQWVVATCEGLRSQTPLRGQSAAALFADTAGMLGRSVTARIDRKQFARRTSHDFDPEAARSFWRALSWVDTQFKLFKAEQRGETSPVQLWPHHFDIALLVYSGRKVPGTDPRDPEMSDEQMNFGFVPGDDLIREAYFYATAYPEPAASRRPRLPRGAHWHRRGWQGAVLPYAVLVDARNPQGRLLEFLRTFRSWGDTLAGTSAARDHGGASAHCALVSRRAVRRGLRQLQSRRRALGQGQSRW